MPSADANDPTRPKSFRPATIADIPALVSIRMSVRENMLVHAVITEDDYAQAITVDGRAWVCEVDSTVVGFACGRLTQGDIWALFVREAFEGQGIGSALLARVTDWMFAAGQAEIWLTTAPGTRADRLYRHLGWTQVGTTATAETKLELRRPSK